VNCESDLPAISGKADTGTARLLRGGVWFNGQWYARRADRFRYLPVNWYGLVGFRVAEYRS